jgi:hypothetical protein
MTDETRARIRARRAECEVRREGTCGRIDILLGYEHGITIEECDACWALGGPSAAAWQREYVQLVVRNTALNYRRVDSVLVLETIVNRHLPAAERAATVLLFAPRIGQERAQKLAEAAGGAALVAQVEALFAAMPDEEQMAALMPSERWSQVSGVWDEIEKASAEEEPELWNIVQKSIYLGDALIGGKIKPEDLVDRRDLNLRNISCFGTDLDGVRHKGACPSLKQQGDEFFCGDCGCGFTKRARLRNKLHRRKLRCPRRMPGFSNARLTVNGKPLSRVTYKAPKTDGVAPGPAGP